MEGALMEGALWLKWVGQLWQCGLLFSGDMFEKHWSSGEYLFWSAHCFFLKTRAS